MQSINELDLSPKPGKVYWKNSHREWREEFIYFLLVDRFHDDAARKPPTSADRQKGFGTPNQLSQTCGGTLRGVINHLDYIHDLGCTSIWLSPCFENNPQAYHGYAIQHYLEIDKRFGTKEDLEELVDRAHAMDMRVFLDVVLHHSGDNWSYPGDLPYYYYNGARFDFGGWRYDDRPLPIELRNPELYNRKGQIRNFDNYPETYDGDFSGLKTFRSDDSPEADYVHDLLLKIHCYWIRECDVDGFRLDAVKHMGEMAVSRFCSMVREYAYKLGKRDFFLFGELISNESLYNEYIGPKTSTSIDYKTIYYGLNSVLDFPLYNILGDVIHGRQSPKSLVDRYEVLRLNAPNRGMFGEYLITFLDNHDQVGQAVKHRFGKDAKPEQIIAGVGFLLTTLGAPCIYYGTEQGFDGSGVEDYNIREAMFSLEDDTSNVLDKKGYIYKQIAAIAAVRASSIVLRLGRMYISKTAKAGKDFAFPNDSECLFAFSRVLYDEEVLVVYNISTVNTYEERITVGRHLHGRFRYLYGGEGEVPVLTEDIEGHTHYVTLRLNPMEFAVLKNVPVPFEEDIL